MAAFLIPAAASIIGGLISKRGGQQANATNINLQREQQAFEERMSNTAVQRAMRDYRAAGLNPMLAGMNPASTPSTGVPRIENVDRDLGASIGSAGQAVQLGLQAKQMQAQTENIKAQTAKTNAEASMVQAQVPYSAFNARQQSFQLETQNRLLSQQAESVIKDIALKDIDIEKMRPLVIAYQQLLNQSEAAGIPEKEAAAKFFEKVPEAKWLAIVRKVLLGGR